MKVHRLGLHEEYAIYMVLLPGEGDVGGRCADLLRVMAPVEPDEVLVH